MNFEAPDEKTDNFAKEFILEMEKKRNKEVRELTTIITAASRGKKHWRTKKILQEVQKKFFEEEIERDSPEFQTILGDIQECRRRNPKQYRLGEEREKLFDRAAKQLVGQRLRGGKVILGCIGHERSFTDIKKGIDRSIVVVGPGGLQIYNFNITGPRWVERHIRARVKIVPVQIETEGVDEQKSIPQIKECIVRFIEEESSA